MDRDADRSEARLHALLAGELPEHLGDWIVDPIEALEITRWKREPELRLEWFFCCAGLVRCEATGIGGIVGQGATHEGLVTGALALAGPWVDAAGSLLAHRLRPGTEDTGGTETPTLALAVLAAAEGRPALAAALSAASVRLWKEDASRWAEALERWHVAGTGPLVAAIRTR